MKPTTAHRCSFNGDVSGDELPGGASRSREGPRAHGRNAAQNTKTDAEKQLLQQQQNASAQFIKRPEIDVELHRQGLDKGTKILTPQQITAAWRIHFAGVNIVHLDRIDDSDMSSHLFNVL